MNLADILGIPPQPLSKLHAARRQLRTAIRLFFEEGDSVSIHTLAAAAHEVLWQLLKVQDGSDGTFLRDTDVVKPEGRKLWNSLTNRPANFFKHAERDSAATLEFNPEVTVFLINDCIRMYARLTGRMLREAVAFTWWFMLEYPRFLKPGPFAESVKRARGEGVHAGGRKTFLKLLGRPTMWADAE